MRIATAAQMRELDRITIQERGVPSTELMERAAEALAAAALELAGDSPRRAVCFCGPGNNGGDGIACARLLLEAGLEARCILVGPRDKLTPDARAMEARLAAAGGRLEPFVPDDPAFAAWCLEADVMVDALFGIGLSTDVDGDACIAAEMEEENARLTRLRDKLISGLLSRIPETRLNGHPTQRLPGNVNVSIRYIEGEALLLSLDMAGIAASSGSACTSGSLDPSHVLLAMGLPHEIAHGSLRLTLGRETTEEEIDRVLEELPRIAQRLRAMSPLYDDSRR